MDAIWMDDYCIVCDKKCSLGSIYCSQACRLHDYQEAVQSVSSPAAPGSASLKISSLSSALAPVPGSYSSRRSSAYQIANPPPVPSAPSYGSSSGSVLFQKYVVSMLYDTRDQDAYGSVDTISTYSADLPSRRSSSSSIGSASSAFAKLHVHNARHTK
ncbi:uncharacterized protein V1518DRAFT_421242 [Limtongia smithiae]|uniref:uncharacterized protein n=1 Tax=Limtongia smithiae TaxID=1125753 RepID=UPI0034CF4D4F